MRGVNYTGIHIWRALTGPDKGHLREREMEVATQSKRLRGVPSPRTGIRNPSEPPPVGHSLAYKMPPLCQYALNLLNYPPLPEQLPTIPHWHMPPPGPPLPPQLPTIPHWHIPMGAFISLAPFGSLKTSRSCAARAFPILPNKYSPPPPAATNFIKDRRDKTFLVDSGFFMITPSP